ncbi:MAG: HEAT repeat domain-containing protein [Gemmatimonadota bacterium]|nr:HEAT repeat domain-containing protein [Gemmatimonadota bacterium]
MNRSQRALAALGILSGVWSSSAQGQSLAQRVASAPDGRVQFSYPAREGACGDGRSYMRLNISANSNEFYGSYNNDASMPPCARGPVRVVLEQAAHTVVGIRVFVGPLSASDGATDLGTVKAREASDYLMGLAAKAEGSVASNALMPAMLADSVNNQPALLAIAKDQSRARETRRSAINWLSRDGRVPTALAASLLAIATDESDNQSVRQSALRTLSHLDGGAGIPELIRLSGDREGGWVAREALSALAASGDPRSREYLRSVVRKGELPDEALATAVRSLGQQYATGSDVALIRESWPKLTGQRSQEAALSAITEFGGAENARWLLALAKDAGVSQNNQRRALQDAVRAGARVSDLIAMYNATVDYQMKDAIIGTLSVDSDRAAMDKLLLIAKGDESITARRRAIAALGKSSDPRIRKELETLAEKTGGKN